MAEVAPIENLGAGTLVALLEHHSNLDTSSLTALACTSKPFKDALDDIWPSKMEAYSAMCKDTAKALSPIPISDTLAYDLDQEACCAYYMTDTDGIGFEFNSLGSSFNRTTALMRVGMARREYFLVTADLAKLQSFKNRWGQKYYRFTDVLQAGMLRYGRKGLLEKMLKLMEREDRLAMKRSDRSMAVDELVQMWTVPAQLLTTRFILKYSNEYVRTGHGRLKTIEERIQNHNRFSYLVSRGATTSIVQPAEPLYLSQAEQNRVAHLQIAYVMTVEPECIEEARRIVQDLRFCSMLV